MRRTEVGEERLDFLLEFGFLVNGPCPGMAPGRLGPLARVPQRRIEVISPPGGREAIIKPRSLLTGSAASAGSFSQRSMKYRERSATPAHMLPEHGTAKLVCQTILCDAPER